MSTLLTLDMRLPDTELDLPEEMLAPPPSLRSILLGRTAIVCYLLLVGGFGSMAYLRWNLQERNAALEASIRESRADSTRYAGDIAQAQLLRARQAQIRATMDTVRRVDRMRYAVPHMLDEVARALPRDTWLEAIRTLTLDAATGMATIEVTGVSPTEQLVGSYIQRLEQSPWMQNVQAQSATQATLGDQQAVRFKLSISSEAADTAFMMTNTISASGLFGDGPRPVAMPSAPLLGGPATAPGTPTPNTGSPLPGASPTLVPVTPTVVPPLQP